MVETIIISKQSRALIRALRDIERNPSALPWYSTTTKPKVSRAAVITWLSEPDAANDAQCPPLLCESRFTRESLRVSLFNDLYFSLLTRAERKTKKIEKKPGWFDYFGVTMLAIAGTIFAICDGFDGVSAILGLFAAIPMWTIFLVGFAFSLLSVAVFYGFDLVEVSKNLGVQLNQSNQLLDVFVDQVEQIKRLRKKIKLIYEENKPDQDALQALQNLLAMLVFRHNDLDKARKAYTSELHKGYLIVLKFIIAGIAGVLFFSYGFFAGQSLALAVLGLFFASVSTMFWPVVLIGVIVGLASFSVYWFVERPGLENLVGRWLGFDKDKIDTLADDDGKQKDKLDKLGKLLSAAITVKPDEKQTPSADAASTAPVDKCANRRVFPNGDSTRPLIAHTLFKHSRSEGDLPAFAESMGSRFALF